MSCYASFFTPESGELCGTLTSQAPRNSSSRRKGNNQEPRDGYMVNRIVHEEVPTFDGFAMDALAMDASSFSLMAFFP